MKWYVQPLKAFLIISGILLFSFKSMAQPANDLCSAAISLTSSTTCVTTAGTINAATYTPPLTGCGATNKSDVWYSFVAQSTTQTVTVSSAPSQVRLQLFSGSCASLTSVICGNTTLTGTGLTIGATYYIRVYTQNNNTGTFNICVTHAAPANDDCAGAVSLSSNTTCSNTTGTLNLASANGATPLGCFGAGTYYDVWYSFVAQATTETVTISSLGANITNPQIQLYGGTCAGLTNLAACGTTSVTKAGLTIGTTYYVRVSNLNANPSGAGTVANFNICVIHTPPANDVCSGAVSLTSGTACVNTGGTLVGASYTTISSIGCGVASRNDVWYSFVAVSANETITLSSAPANPRIQLFSGTCGTLTSVACGTSSLVATGLTVGATYYVRIYTDPNTISASNTFNICVTHTLPANDNCAGAISLTSLTACVNTAGTLNLATASGGVAGCFGAGTYYDVWFSFVAQATTETVTISSLGANITNPQIQLYGGTCAGLTNLTTCGTTTITNVALTIGTTYYVRVANLNADPSGAGTAASFNICVTHIGLANDLCQGAITITSGTSCSPTAGTLVGATYTAGLTDCGGFGSVVDAWYSFVAQSPIPAITITGSTTRIEVEIFSGTCGALTCLGGTTGNGSPKTLNVTNLTIGQTYYVRLTTNNNSTPTFTVCIVDPTVASPPANDNCSAATSLTPGSSCINTGGTLAGATVSSPVVASTCGTPGADVWYSFTATSNFPTISLSSIGSSIQSGTAYIQILSGTCGSLTSLYCTSGVAATLSLTPGGTGLAIGTTYYVRIYTSSTYTGGSNWGFNICITNPSSSTTAVVDYSKSYINVTKLATGGSVEPGDVLEIRATFVVRSGTVDSVAFYDTLRNNNGYSYLSGNMSTQTNEGKVYGGPFTEALDGDAGTYAVVPSTSDSAIRISMGTGATGYVRGTLLNTSKPSFYTSTCIIMATYRVQVTANYDTKINWGGGAFTYKDNATGVMKLISFKNDSLAVYISPGLCSSSLSSVNKVGIETDGTFNTPSNPAPLARNRGTSTAVPSYTYATFKTGGGPQDYFYGITNNTSATYTTSNTFGKGGTVPQRVFALWDIIGDHTGATNTSKGNPPCDTTLPKSASNPCGYMLVVNAAYKTDTAFRSTVSNLCPNTYYEISAWVRNICYKCGCDVNGVGASGGGYIPFATNDSSGIPPNLAFQVNGQDYYSTGNIYYTGTGAGITPTASDSVNKWVKRGFVYKTENAQTSFELLIRNNAPGGGGNDWAIDDIVVASCLPIMTYSPSLSPAVCDSNTITIYDTVRSNYENYTYYKWQRSTDGGANWTDITGNLGPATPVWNGTAWEYVASYTIPPAFTTPGHNSDQYRMIVATTSGNLGNVNCQATDVVSIITLNVIDCGIPLKTDMLSFNGRLINDHSNLFWSTTSETEPLRFDVERSNDGTSFTVIGSVNSNNDYRSQVNYYSFTDPQPVTGKAWYRIIMVNKSTNKKQSRTIQLTNGLNQFEIVNTVNPFTDQVLFDVMSPEDGKIDVALISIVGKTIREKSYTVYTGVNGLSIDNTNGLPAGMYILQVKNKDIIISRKLLKK
ncbi:MAG: T9SS type A sorting domain-containing protein [Chitinophagaceae bacterium]